MFRVTLKNLAAAHKLRLLTTALAVLLGVAFMAGTLVLTDTIGKTFDGLFADANAGHRRLRAVVERGRADGLGDQRPRIDASLARHGRARPTASTGAAGYVEGYAQIVGKDGKVARRPRTGRADRRRVLDRPTTRSTRIDVVEGRAPAPPTRS